MSWFGHRHLWCHWIIIRRAQFQHAEDATVAKEHGKKGLSHERLVLERRCITCGMVELREAESA